MCALSRHELAKPKAKVCGVRTWDGDGILLMALRKLGDGALRTFTSRLSIVYTYTSLTYLLNACLFQEARRWRRDRGHRNRSFKGAWPGRVAQAPRAGRALASWSCSPCWRVGALSRCSRLEDQLGFDGESNSKIAADGSDSATSVRGSQFPQWRRQLAVSDYPRELWLQSTIQYAIIRPKYSRGGLQCCSVVVL